MTGATVSVLFLCQTNAARSIMAEAVLNHLGQGRIRAYSAGSKPATFVHPETIRVLSAHGYLTDSLQPKSWNLFAQSDTPLVQLVVTVCDDVADESCPPWPGRPTRAHWQLTDPVAEWKQHDGDPHAFQNALKSVEDHIRALLIRLDGGGDSPSELGTRGAL